MSVQKLLKLLVTDDKPLCFPEGFLPCVLSVNQKTLEYLHTQWMSMSTCVVIMMIHKNGMHFFSCHYLPADWVELDDRLRHVFVNVEGVDDRVDFERHFILLAPVADLVEVIQVALSTLGSANQLIGTFVKTVTGDGQNVQIVTYKKERERWYKEVILQCG